jgi:hypothetical protein
MAQMVECLHHKNKALSSNPNTTKKKKKKRKERIHLLRNKAKKGSFSKLHIRKGIWEVVKSLFSIL